MRIGQRCEVPKAQTMGNIQRLSILLLDNTKKHPVVPLNEGNLEGAPQKLAI